MSGATAAEEAEEEPGGPVPASGDGRPPTTEELARAFTALSREIADHLEGLHER